MTSLSRSLDAAIREENRHAIEGTDPDRSLLAEFLDTPIEDVLSDEALAILINNPRGRGKGRHVRELEALGS